MTSTPFPLVVDQRRAKDDRRHGDRRKDGTHPALDLPMPQRLSSDAYKVAGVIDRDVDFYIASYEFEQSVLRNFCTPAEKPRQHVLVDAAEACVHALQSYRNAIALVGALNHQGVKP